MSAGNTHLPVVCLRRFSDSSSACLISQSRSHERPFQAGTRKPVLSGACLTREEDDEQERAKASGL